jgi:hypothetical protein
MEERAKELTLGSDSSQMQILADIKKNFLQNRWRREFRAKGTISPAQTSILADLLLQKLSPQEMKRSPTSSHPFLIDEKGRDQENLLLSSFPTQKRPTGQELLYIEGTSRDRDTSITIRINTPFSEFKGKEIHHLVQEERSQSTPTFLRTEMLGYIAPFTIHSLRFARERYHTVFKALSFGYTSEVTEQITLDIHNGELALTLSGENLTSPEEIPWGEIGKRVLEEVERV